MGWTHEKTEWLDQPIDEERERTPFYERGSRLLVLWAQHCLLEFALKLRIGYAMDAETGRRTHAIIGVSFNGELPVIEFSVKEMREVIKFLEGTKNRTVAGVPEHFAKEYQESLEGFIASLQTGIESAQQFEPNNIN